MAKNRIENQIENHTENEIENLIENQIENQFENKIKNETAVTDQTKNCKLENCLHFVHRNYAQSKLHNLACAFEYKGAGIDHEWSYDHFYEIE